MDEQLNRTLDQATHAARAAGHRLADGFTGTHQLSDWDQVVAAIADADRRSLEVLRPLLERARPQAGWVEDELADGPLAAGEWWVADPVEGAINYVHGVAEWAVTATLVRDNLPVLTVVHLPVTGTTYTAVAGQGAHRDGERLAVSPKTGLRGAYVGTGQASPRESAGTWSLIGRSLTAMMAAAGVTRASVPATLQLIQVAAGRTDGFWQHSAVRSGLLAGALLVAEAGGTVTDLHGRPWSLDSTDFLAATPGIHAEAAGVLSSAVREG
ncbi:3'(2'),5'-bisphosphate nucleotidase CysQ [Kineosporia sp. J2-2]|uniref:3'(2'),5'-bisphosphate nucleotidase CysQ n=1 Tax=Kineosporia corallincola TaxID=2835133 RepID=A0ABS5TRF2_9ACTN|nr:inositol monophosphatase family protein [Kineosporia corallincola]MBT0773377.1 3'(2'),5'-bisphosphate nucleotidase CysQ [Kineosporia corallincola]